MAVVVLSRLRRARHTGGFTVAVIGVVGCAVAVLAVAAAATGAPVVVVAWLAVLAPSAMLLMWLFAVTQRAAFGLTEHRKESAAGSGTEHEREGQ